ncbi:MAG: hypothetical protein MRY63_07720 [Neomegalonema sp.]|nr:hypothetical protein [Neomegalonema sp.]
MAARHEHRTIIEAGKEKALYRSEELGAFSAIKAVAATIFTARDREFDALVSRSHEKATPSSYKRARGYAIDEDHSAYFAGEDGRDEDGRG